MKATGSFETWYHTTKKNSNPYTVMGTRYGEILSQGLSMPLIPYGISKKPVDSLI
jgi:hypothetical protein